MFSVFRNLTRQRIEEELSPLYKSTRYHPVRLGDFFKERTKQWVSMKILTSDSDIEKATHERDVLVHLRDSNSKHFGHNHVLCLTDSFYHHGPNGQHMCLMYKAMGEGLNRFQARMPKKRYPLPLMKRITRQLLQAVDYVHSCGYVHTDISPNNILTELDEDSVLAQYLSDIPNAADLAKLGSKSPIPTTQMRAPSDYLHINIRLADFGEARRIAERQTGQVQPKRLRAPEVTLGAEWDSKIDIWNVACIIWEGFEQRLLFDGRISPTDKYSSEGHLREIVHQIGPAPPKLISRSEHGATYFNASGNVRGLHSLNAPRIWEHEENLEGTEQLDFIDFMKSMLKWLPEDRQSAKELLQHKWLNTSS